MAQVQAQTQAQAKTKKLGLIGCTALVVGNMIGSGIFVLPATIAPYGLLALLGWVTTAFGAIVLALVFGRLARRYSRTGGPYAWTQDGFGEFAGFLIAWGYWITLWTGNAAVAVAFAGYLAYFFPELGAGFGGLAASVGAIWLVTFVCLMGTRKAGNLQVLTTVLKVLPLLLIIALGVLFFDANNLAPVDWQGPGVFSQVALCATLTLWAFVGLESATVPADDVDNPTFNIPLATVIGVVFAAVIYIAVTVAVFGLMPAGSLAQSSSPLADAALATVGGWGGIVIALGAMVSTFGTLNGFTLLAGQVPYGAAKDGVFPRFFTTTNAKGAPVNALILSSLLASVVVSLNYSKSLVDQFTFIVLLATLTTLIPYIFCALVEVMIVLRGQQKERISPVAVVLGSIAFSYSLWAIFGAGEKVVFYGFLLLLAGLPFHIFMKWKKRSYELVDLSVSSKGESI